MLYPSKLRMPTERLPQAIASRYGLEVAVARVRCGYMSTVVELVADRARYVLKVYRTEEMGPQGPVDGLAAGKSFRAAGIPMPEAVRAFDGRAFAEWGGNTFMLLPRIEGTIYEPGNRDQLDSAADMLGRMHRATPTRDPVPWKEEWDRILSGIEQVVVAVRRAGAEAPPAVVPLLDAGLERVRGEGGLPTGLSTALVHGDYRAQNLLYDGSRIAAVLDMDEARVAPRLLDLAYAGVFFQAVVSGSPLSPEEWEAFLAGYCSQIPLDALERRHLPHFLLLAWMKGIALWLRIACLERMNDRARGWIASYTPMGARLLEGLE